MKPQKLSGKILVTGATGFIGKHFLNALIREVKPPQIVTVGRSPQRTVGQHVVCDLTDQALVERLLHRVQPSFIFHLAGAPAPSDSGILYESYIETTVTLIQAAQLKLHKKCRLILSGSAAEYGIVHKKDLPLGEDHICSSTITPYGRVKLMQTYLALSGISKKLEVTVGRVFNLLGPDCPEHLVVGSWARQLADMEQRKTPKTLLVGNLNKGRDFIDVRDVASAFIKLAQVGRSGRIYNICSERSHPLQKILALLIKRSFHRDKIRIKTEAVRVRRNRLDVENIYGSSRRLRQETGWRPLLSLEESLLDTLNSARLRTTYK